MKKKVNIDKEMKKKKGCASRFADFRKLLGLNKNQFAKILRCTIQSICYYEDAKTWIPIRRIYQLDEIHHNACFYILGSKNALFTNLDELVKAKLKALKILESNN